MKKRTLINWLGLLGIVSLLSYTAAVVLSPLAYPGYDWKSQAVSDLSAANAPSLALWNQLNSLYGLCGIVCVMAVCVFIENKLNKTLRIGVYLFAAMNWVSAVGYSAFPLTGDNTQMTFQNRMHIAVTIAVVVLSIASLICIIIGGFSGKNNISLATWAAAALAMMCAGAVGTNAAPPELFGVFERLSVFAATGFNAVLGVYLFTDKLGGSNNEQAKKQL
ncbi:MAG: DUF998 domain-containing protein [Oscillospiraceae bacterium]|jgi:hypothetical membrane protein|nr:DUF998 domain-containing protein [Oscillospiraceae bacterium]